LVNLFSQSSWTASCVVGVIVGNAIGVPLAIASFAMTSIFICLLVTQKVTTANVVAAVCAMVGVFVCKLVGLSGPAIFIGALVGVTGGYLWGFLAAALVYWALERFGKLPAMVAGQAVCYLCGSLWFMVYSGGGMGLILLRCVVPYLIPDGVKIALAYTLSRRLARHLILFFD
jgi:biotin transporter BioY